MFARSNDLWYAMGAVVVVVALQNLTINNLSFGQPRLAPAAEALVLLLLAVTMVRHFRASRRLHGPEWEHTWARNRRLARNLALALAAVVSIANAVSLFHLLEALVFGRVKSGLTILVDAMNIWGTNVIVFSLWYSLVDDGGPFSTEGPAARRSEFIFPHMTVPAEPGQEVRAPGFMDYLFLSFTTSTAFSPTDTLPLSARMKLLMMLQAMISLLTLALVAARAVNLIG